MDLPQSVNFLDIKVLITSQKLWLCVSTKLTNYESGHPSSFIERFDGSGLGSGTLRRASVFTLTTNWKTYA